MKRNGLYPGTSEYLRPRLFFDTFTHDTKNENHHPHRLGGRPEQHAGEAMLFVNGQRPVYHHSLPSLPADYEILRVLATQTCRRNGARLPARAVAYALERVSICSGQKLVPSPSGRGLG